MTSEMTPEQWFEHQTRFGSGTWMPAASIKELPSKMTCDVLFKFWLPIRDEFSYVIVPRLERMDSSPPSIGSTQWLIWDYGPKEKLAALTEGGRIVAYRRSAMDKMTQAEFEALVSNDWRIKPC